MNRPLPEGLTRDCTFAWTNVEIMANGDVRPCCARAPVGNLAKSSLAEILNGEMMIVLRASLLTGDLDRDCADCRLQPKTTREALVEKVRALRLEIFVPPEFDASLYLVANPDVAAANVDPLWHYRHFGRLEGRPLRPPRFHVATAAKVNASVASNMRPDRVRDNST